MRPATCRHDPGCGSELACIARGQAEGASYRRHADERRRDEEQLKHEDFVNDVLYAAKRGVKALEAIAAALEKGNELEVEAEARDGELEDLQERLETANNTIVEHMKAIRALQMQRPVYGQADLGVRCRACGKPITGIGAVAGSMKCLECHKKPTL